MGSTFLLYADSSGDDGVFKPSSDTSSTSYYAISGIIINILQWQSILEKIIAFRKQLRIKYSFLMRRELKGANFFHLKSTDLFKNTNCNTRKRRMLAYHYIMKSVPTIFRESKVLNLFLDKTKTRIDNNKYFEICWKDFLERYQRFLDKHNSLGIFIPDEGKEKELTRLTRKLRKFNPVPSHYGGSYSFLLKSIIEDPFHRDSKDSYFIQFCDLIVYALYRKEKPKGSFRKYNGERLFDYIEPILLKEATRKDALGIIRP